MALRSQSYRELIHRKLIQPFVDLLKQGISPEKIALTIALGISLGLIPMLGTTTTLCTLAALALRLNLPAIMVVNAAVYPLQIAFLIPFLRAGAWLFRVQSPQLTIGQIFQMIRASVWHTILALFTATMHALVVWLIASCAVGGLVYLLTVTLLRRFWTRPSVIN
jgi:uncharacterized protein (DUF2062 family)